MENQETPLGRAGFLVIPIGIVLAVVFKSFWVAVILGAATGFLIANVRAVLYVGRLRGAMERDPLLGLRAKFQGVDSSSQIRFIFMQSVIGAVVFATWTAAVAVVVLLLR